MEAVSKLQITKENTNVAQRLHRIEERRDSERSSARSKQLEFVEQSNGIKELLRERISESIVFVDY